MYVNEQASSFLSLKKGFEQVPRSIIQIRRMTNFGGEALISSLLDLPKVGTKTVEKLLRVFGLPMHECAGSMIDGILAYLSEKGIEVAKSTFCDLYNQHLHALQDWEQKGIHCLGYWNPHFPPNLRTIPDPPVHLYVQGNVGAVSLPSVAVVGTREPTRFGLLSARRIGFRLASRQIAVVSGLAEGCDTEAHWGCLDGGGHTVAVLAHGFGKIYPASNAPLADEILQRSGALVSEYSPNTPPLRSSFVRRDRIQSGLSRMIVVVETGVKGGTMHTVGFAKEQNRILAAINHPQRWLSHEKVAGNQFLIANNAAAPLSDLADLLQLVGKAFDEQ